MVSKLAIIMVPMKVALFIPCYIDALYPQVGIHTLELLERAGVSVAYPSDQTCCGQPMANSGFAEPSRDAARRFIQVFDGYSHIVCPSGSCTSMVRNHYRDLLGESPAVQSISERTWELCQFLTQVVGWKPDSARYPGRVALHPSCHGLRELRLGPCSERPETRPDIVRELLSHVSGLELVSPARRDECCGFGGTFAVSEEAVSVRMGNDRIDDYAQAGAEIITAVDMSCLMHLDGLIRRRQLKLRTMHVAELLNEACRA